ncbi:MAG: aromatic aminobenezylarsenical efflux permease ArsG family transporter [Desulfobacterales bacterium]
MAEWFILTAGALWMGILTSISPCPLATNIAAISFIGRRMEKSGAAFWTGILYAAGRTLAYVLLGLFLVNSLFSVPMVSMWLQDYMNRLMGPILILTGMFVLGILKAGFGIDFVGEKFSRWTQQIAEKGGLIGALLLGFFFALSFCPVSAALFFGSLIPLALKHHSGLMLPLVYGTGTALPVVVFGFLLAFGGSRLGRAFDRLAHFEPGQGEAPVFCLSASEFIFC